LKSIVSVLKSKLRRIKPASTKAADAQVTDAHINLVNKSGVFDQQWYLDAYPDVLAADADPLKHYLAHGGFEGRNPNPFFHTTWYLEQNPDVAAAGLNPLIHYLSHGEIEGRWPCPALSPKFYRKIATGIGEGPGALLQHYLLNNHRVSSLTRLNEIARIHNAWHHKHRLDEPVTIGLFAPLISVVLPTYNSKPKLLREAIESVAQQTYSNWELCIVDDGSTSEDCLALLKEYENTDSRIRVYFSPINGGIAQSSRIAVNMAKGDYISFLDHDDVLTNTALRDVVEFLEVEPSVDYVYTDHAMIAEDGTFLHSAFKPAWSPEFLLATNYIVHFKVVRAALLKTVDGFRDESHVIQDLDLTLRLVEARAKIRHLPLMLYFWRTHPLSVASGTSAKPSIERLALEVYNGHLERRGVQAIASAEWPVRFRAAKLGAYKLKFLRAYSASTTVIALVRPGENVCWEDLRELAGPETQLRVVFLGDTPEGKLPRGAKSHKVERSSELTELIRTVSTPNLVFVRGTARLLTRDWLTELVGYLDLDGDIGLVGGKVLDFYLNVAGAGGLLLEKPETLSLGHSDNIDGHWLSSQISSNVESVSSALFAIRKTDFLKTRGLEIFEYGDDAGIALGLEIRKLGLRAVYSPWSRVLDSGAFVIPVDSKALLKSTYGAMASDDRYYNPNFSKFLPFAYRDA